VVSVIENRVDAAVPFQDIEGTAWQGSCHEEVKAQLGGFGERTPHKLVLAQAKRREDLNAHQTT
jgi:hypothetical protein